MAVVWARGYSSDLTLSLETSICCGCGHKKIKKKKKRERERERDQDAVGEGGKLERQMGLTGRALSKSVE